MVTHRQLVDGLPAQATAFIGRGDDLGELKDLLADPDCRLLTLVGPGGSGKTRLAIEAARESSDGFADGVHFVGLDSVGSTDLVVPAIADAVAFSLRGQDDPRAQLLRHLNGKSLLLILDNFEHLLAAAGLLGDMLSQAAGLKVLVTSREILNLREEWVRTIGGMSFPINGDVRNLDDYDAVRLFVEHAHRVKQGFSLEDERTHVVRICQLVEGLPLAIELAASWLKLMSCGDIVSEVQRSLDFLETSLRNVPTRHRSIRAVFDQSWRLLTDEEREVFKRLSAFQASFDRKAAAEVTGASLQLLSALVDKSLLKSLPDGRYKIHELLRQYAAEKLAESFENASQVRDRCCAYYMGFLESQLARAARGQQLQMAAEVEAELENIRACWTWAVDQGNAEQLRKVVPALGLFWQFRSRYVEAAASLEKAAQSLDGAEASEGTAITLALVLVHLGWFYIRLGRLHEAQVVLRRCQELYEAVNLPPVEGWATDPALALGVMATIKGDYARAARFGEEARQTAAQGNPSSLDLAYYVMARAAFLQGDLRAAQTYAQQAYAAASDAGDHWFTAYCLLELGNVECALGDYAAAKRHYLASYEIRREFADPEGMAIALGCLGDVAARQQSYEEAQELYQRSLSIYKGIDDKGGLASSHCGAGKAAAASGDHEAARYHFREALRLSADIQFVPLVLSIVVGVADVLLRAGQPEGGLELAALALNHPVSHHEAKSCARELIARCQAEGAPHVRDGRDGFGDLQRAESLLNEALSISTDLGLRSLLARAATGTDEIQPPSDSALTYPDDLTEREVEVLRLISRGRSNRGIAEELFITTNTVANHVKNILSKTNSANRTEAASYAMRKRLV